MGSSLACQEHTCSEDEDSIDEDAQMDVWESQERYDQDKAVHDKTGVASVVYKMRGSKVDMVRTCEDKVYKCVNKEV